MLVAQPGMVCGPALTCTLTLAPLVNEGAWFTGSTVTVKDCTGLTSTRPSAVPPLSRSWTERWAAPELSGLGVKVNVPSGLSAGWVAKSSGWSEETTNVRTAFGAGAGSPAWIEVAQFSTV